MDGPATDDAPASADLTAAGATGVRWATIARVGIELAGFGSAVVLARLIPPEDFGRFALVIIVQELALTVTGEGIGSALVQRRTVSPEHLQGGALLCLMAAAVLAILTLVVSLLVVTPVFGHETAGLVQMATPWFLLAALTAVPTAVLRRRLAFKRLSILDLSTTSIRCIVTVALALIGMNGSALVLGGLCGAAVGTALVLSSVPVAHPRWRGRAMREILGFGVPAALAGISWTGFRNGDYAVIGARAGNAQAGLYWRSYMLAVDYPRKLTAVMSQVGFPVLARTSGIEEMFVLRRRMTRLMVVLLMPPLAGLALFAPIAVPWLFGPAWEPAVVPTQILAAGGAVSMLIDAIGPVLMAAGRPRRMLWFGLGHFIVYVGAVWVLVPSGLVAVAVGGVLVHTVFLLIAYVVLLRGLVERPLRCLWDDIAPAAISIVGFVVVAAPVGWVLERTGAPVPATLLTAGVLGGVVYLAALRAAFADAWHDLTGLLRRILPETPRRFVGKRLTLAGVRSS